MNLNLKYLEIFYLNFPLLLRWFLTLNVQSFLRFHSMAFHQRLNILQCVIMIYKRAAGVFFEACVYFNGSSRWIILGLSRWKERGFNVNLSRH